MNNFENLAEIYENVDPHLLARSILQKSLVEQPELFRAFQFFLFKQVQAGISFYSMNQFTHTVELTNYDGKPQNTLELPAAPAFKIQWIPFSPNYIACFDNGEFESVVDRQKLGINLNEKNGGFLYNDSIYSMSSWLCEFIPKNEISAYPYDLYLSSSSSDYVFITDRGSGKILVLDLTLSKILANIPVRKPGNKKAINTAYNPLTRCCYLTDGQTPDIISVNMDKISVDRFYQNYGTLGNMVINPSSNKLYVFLCQSDNQPAIIILSLPSFTLESTIILGGRRFSDLDDPTDLLTLSADGKYLYAMTYTDSPALFTPMISVITTDDNKLYKTYSLKKDEKPIGIASRMGPFTPYPVSFPQILLEKGLLKPEELKAVLSDLTLLKDKIVSQELDQDVVSTTANISEELAKDVQIFSNMKKEVADKWLNNPNYSWQGRKNMSAEEKTEFIEKVAEIETKPEVKKANSVFVLKWLQDFFN